MNAHRPVAGFSVGDRVTVIKHTTKKYEGEEGTIQAFAGQDSEYAVVLTCGAAPLVFVKNLEHAE